jgi:hypothetical protein
MAVVELEEVGEGRVGKLESDVQHLQADVTEIKADARQFRSEMLARFEKVDARFERIEQALSELRAKMIRGDLQTRIWMLLSNGTVLAVMAHGFKWI